jgi:hypothetical protein
MVLSRRPNGLDTDGLDTSALGSGLNWLATIVPANSSPLSPSRLGNRYCSARWSMLACLRLGSLLWHGNQASAIGEGQ